jgi:glycosyltransferase involved in cell wall biosynthesis
MVLVTELSDSGDEGMRNWLKMADRALERQGWRTELVRLEGDPRWAAFTPRARRRLREKRAEALVYVPYSGLTTEALVRHAALRSAAAARADAIVALQAAHSVRVLSNPGLVAYASARLRDAHATVGRRNCVLPPAVDSQRFRPSKVVRHRLREELGLPTDGRIVLHVGHLRPSRGLEPLSELAATGAASVVMVASQTTQASPTVERVLREAGVLVTHGYVPHIERWYQAADVYIFPVSDLQGSIEVPLTVLEAMACGLPVATTPFGGLPTLFPESSSLRYADPSRLAQAAASLLGADGFANRSAVASMTEDAFAAAFEHALFHPSDE